MTLAQRLWTSKGMRTGLLLLAAGVVPLLLYIAFGPKMATRSAWGCSLSSQRPSAC